MRASFRPDSSAALPSRATSIRSRRDVTGRAPEGRLARARFDGEPESVAETVIERSEVVALLFNVSDIAVTLTSIERLLGEDDGEEEADEG